MTAGLNSFKMLVPGFLCFLGVFVAVCFCTGWAMAAAPNSGEEAATLFRQYKELEHAYDPALADLFSATATIKDTRVYQDGQSKTLIWTGENYKSILKAQLPVAKARNEQFIYSSVSYKQEGNNVRIKCSRASAQKNYSVPLEMLVGPHGKNGWKIMEETYQSQP